MIHNQMGVLAESLNSGELLYTEAEWRRRIGDMFDILLESDYLHGPSIVEQLPCELCDQPGHRAFVRYDEGSSTYQITCLVAGSVRTTQAEVELYSFTSDALIALICEAAGIVRRASVHRASDDLIPLGAAELGKTAYGVYILPSADLPETLNKFVRRNRAGFGIEPSIVLCAQKPQILPEDIGVHSVVEVGELLIYEADAFRFRTKVLRQALGLSQSGRKSAPVLKAAISSFLRYLKEEKALPTGEQNLRNVFEKYGPQEMSAPGRSTLFEAKRLAKEMYERNPNSAI